METGRQEFTDHLQTYIRLLPYFPPIVHPERALNEHSLHASRTLDAMLRPNQLFLSSTCFEDSASKEIAYLVHKNRNPLENTICAKEGAAA